MEVTAPPVAAERTEAPALSVAGLWPRFAAFLVDGIVAGVPVLILGQVLEQSAWGAALSQPLLFHFTGLVLLRRLLFAAYFALTTLMRGATVGKRLLRLRVVAADGTPAARRDILYRETVGRLLSGFLWLGYLVLAADREHRGFHDMLCDTRVVYR